MEELFKQEILESDEKRVLSSYLAQNLIFSLSKEEFSKDNALKNLLKSDSFFKELFTLFKKFLKNSIKKEELLSFSKNLPEPDKTRFEAVLNVYEKFIDTVKDSGYEIYFEKEQKPREASEHAVEKEYLIFEDIYDEIAYISAEIKQKVSDNDKEGAKYSDFGIFIRDFEARQKFTGMFKTFEIPVNSLVESDELVNYKRSILRYLKIFNIYKNIGISDFSKSEFEKLHFLSKSQSEILNEELNENYKSILDEILEDTFAKDRFEALLEKRGGSLLSIIACADWLNEKDRAAVDEEFKNIRVFYSKYFEGDLAEFFSMAGQKYDSKIFKPLLKRTKELKSLYSEVFKTQIPEEVIYSLVENTFEANEESKKITDNVSICPLEEQKSFRYVYIPSMCENSFPKKNTALNFISPDSNEMLSNAIKTLYPDFDEIVVTDTSHLKKEEEIFYSALQNASEKVTLSTHLYEDKKECAPSIYFDMNQSKKPDMLKTSKEERIGLTQGEQKTIAECVIDKDEVLKLNASAISSFLRCPRRYYYKGLLNLKEQSEFAADYGNIVHAVLEVFHRECITNYNKETLISLKNILFESVSNPETALQAGFRQLDIDLVKAADKLSLEQMKNDFDGAIEELEKNGLFENPPQEAFGEVDFTYNLSELKNVYFDGRIDAILKKDNGYRVIDYKTGKNKDNDLDYALSDFGVNFLSKTGKIPSRIEDYQKKYDYQIPLYSFACENAKNLLQFKGKIKELGLMYVRPKERHGGYFEDMIEVSRIEAHKEKLIENLKTTVVDKIRSSKEFEMCESFNCENCPFEFLCEEEPLDE